MNTAEFQQLLIRSSVTMMAVDGTIDDSEIAALKEYSNGNLYFYGLDLELEIEGFAHHIKAEGKSAINEFLELLGKTKLSSRQQKILYDVLIKVLEADGRIDSNEIQFLSLVRSTLGTSQALIATYLPNKIHLFLDIERHSNQPFDMDKSLK